MEQKNQNPLFATDQEIEEWINSLSSIPPTPIIPGLVLEPLIYEPDPELAKIDSLINFFEQKESDEEEVAVSKKTICPRILSPIEKLIKAIRTSEYRDASKDIDESQEAINQKTVLSLCHLLRPNNCEKQDRFAQEVTPLIFACYQKKPVLVSMLLERNANPNLAGHEGITPLLVATANEQYDIVKKLLNSGADCSLSTRDGLSALSLAFKRNNRSLISLFSQKQRSNLEQPLSYKLADNVLFTGYWAEQRWLEKLFATIDDPEKSFDVYLLTKPEKRGDLNALFLQNAPSILFPGFSKRMITALHFACYKDNIDAIRILLAQGANPNVVEFYGVTPLMIAAARGKYEIATALLQNAARKHYKETLNNLSAGEIAERNGHENVKKVIMYHPE